MKYAGPRERWRKPRPWWGLDARARRDDSGNDGEDGPSLHRNPAMRQRVAIGEGKTAWRNQNDGTCNMRKMMPRPQLTIMISTPPSVYKKKEKTLVPSSAEDDSPPLQFDC